MGRSPQCYYQVSWKSTSRFQWKRFLKGFYHIYGHGGHLGHVTKIKSLAAIVSEKSTVFTFSNGKAQVTKFDLAIK